ncbi:MAG: kynureninase [Saprospiraceae bacterium]|nr:kynureninase [Saprospiraceae bacterium]
MTFQNDLVFAQEQDNADSLSGFRQKFHFPKTPSGKDFIYLTGNSLGLQPKATAAYLQQELSDWQNLGVEGHFRAKNPWKDYHEFLTDAMARVVGAKPIEVVVMNNLTVNLHLLMASFYRPTAKRYKILIENNPFPSDEYAVKSQIQFHGYDVEKSLIKLPQRGNISYFFMADIEQCIRQHGEEIALILIGNVNYLTGQAFDMHRITTLGHSFGCKVGFDLAHGAGNLLMNLHDIGCDFAAWCSYKYLNAGPGGPGGVFVHERHANDDTLLRFAGWWGHDKFTRFNMPPDFKPLAGAEGWQLSNPSVFALAGLKASLTLFDETTMLCLREKSIKLTAYLYYLIMSLSDDRIFILTPESPNERGAQLSIAIKGVKKSIIETLSANGVIADWREPNVVRIAAVPMYCSYEDAWQFVAVLKKVL